MNAQEFVNKWRGVELKERSFYQEHFLDLCALVGHGSPAALDPKGERFTFEVEVRAFEKVLKKRTLTNLYNERPTWLQLAHEKLDRAVMAAYGWAYGISDEEILERLLALNLERARGRRRIKHGN